MSKSITDLKMEYYSRQPYVTSHTIVEIFGKASIESWDGALALIDAFIELNEETGEYPSIDLELYLVIKEYWSKGLGNDLLKLDKFLAMVKLNK